MSSLFNRPVPKVLGPVNVLITLVAWDQFDDAIRIGTWLQQLPDMMPTIDDLDRLRKDGEMCSAIDRLVAGCISLVPAGEPHVDGSVPRQFTIADVRAMPIMTLLEAVLLIMEVNVDFFLTSLQTCMAIKNRMPLTGSPLLSSSSAPATTEMVSGATPSAN
ncbi:hypothetical protein [Burkholderia arboris]|uniref:hypothetical protein n=1 Tax=Burkholderia arboris TaxID=488730 RepID=UPI00158F242A|nr:hypothetical protein [Burkholderia arboris]